MKQEIKYIQIGLENVEVINIDVSIIDSLCLFEGEPHRLINKAAIKSALANQYENLIMLVSTNH